MKRYMINGFYCYTVAGELAIDLGGFALFAYRVTTDVIVHVLGMDDATAVALIEEHGEDVDIVGDGEIQSWATEMMLS